jgi:hypothetical protein
MAIQIDPYRVGGVRVGLHKRWPPLPIEDVPIEVVDEHRLASELEVRVRVMTAVAPATPRPRLLLRDAEHHDAAAVLPLGFVHVLASDVLLHIRLGEPHHRDVVGLRERVDLLHIGTTDPPQDRRRRDRPARPIVQEPDQLPVALQPRDVARQEDPIDRTDLQRDVIGE